MYFAIEISLCFLMMVHFCETVSLERLAPVMPTLLTFVVPTFYGYTAA